MSRKKYLRDFTFADYGISRSRQKALGEFCRERANLGTVKEAARKADAVLADWLVTSITEKKSFEKVEYTAKLGRIPCGRTNFYAYKRLLYHLLDEKLKDGAYSKML